MGSTGGHPKWGLSFQPHLFQHGPSGSPGAGHAAHEMKGGVMNKKSWSAAMMVPLAAAATVSMPATAASAVGPSAPDAARARAQCSDFRSDITFNGRVNANDRIVLNLRVTTNRPRPAWDVRIVRQDREAAANRPIFESREFAAREGIRQQRSFEVVTRTANRPGPDRFVARAVHVASGEVCRVAIVVRGNNAVEDE